MILMFRFKLKNLRRLGWRSLQMKKSKKSSDKLDKSIFKKNPEILQEYFKTMRQHHVVASKKGKGSYKRKEKYNHHEDD